MRPHRALTAGCAVAGAVVLAQSGYLAVLSVAALRRRRRATETTAPATLAVVVPAHDEEQVIAGCIRTLHEQRYPTDAVEVVVVADNCTDSTATIARDLGCTVLERSDPDRPGKGYALRWAMDQLLERSEDIEAFVVVDADSVVDPGLLTGLSSAMSAGADVAQADYEALVEGTDARAHLRAASFLLFHRARFLGKAQLGLPCSLVGNGMLISRTAALSHPWSAFSEVEDLEYTIHLRLAGVRPVFVPDAHLSAPVASGGAAARVQRQRWEGGRLTVTRRYLGRLTREAASGRRPELWDLVADLATPPLGVLAAVSVAGTGSTGVLVAAGAVRAGALVPWVAAMGGLAGHVLVGLLAAQAPPDVYRALMSAPLLIASETRVRLRAASGRRDVAWTRTPRSVSSLGSRDG